MPAADLCAVLVRVLDGSGTDALEPRRILVAPYGGGSSCGVMSQNLGGTPSLSILDSDRSVSHRVPIRSGTGHWPRYGLLALLFDMIRGVLPPRYQDTR